MKANMRREMRVWVEAGCVAAVIVWRLAAPVIACIGVAVWVILFGSP